MAKKYTRHFQNVLFFHLWEMCMKVRVTTQMFKVKYFAERAIEGEDLTLVQC